MMEVIKLFCVCVDEVVKVFGYSSYMICDVNVGSGCNVQLYMCMMVMVVVLMDSVKMSVLIVVEGGKVIVLVIVNGFVQMK